MAEDVTPAPKVSDEPGSSRVGGTSSSMAAPRRDGLVAGAIVALVAGTVLLGALLPSSPVQHPVAPDRDASCAEWSDGCRVCQRLADGPGCSMPGIACVPAEPRCLRRVGG